MITDQSGRIIEVNSTFTELTGYTREEMLAATVGQLSANISPYTQVAAIAVHIR